MKPPPVQRGTYRWELREDAPEVPYYVCRAGQSPDAAARALGLRLLTRAEQRDGGVAVVAVISNGKTGELPFPATRIK